MEIINDLVEPAELTGFVREVPDPATYVLNQILPDEFIEDIEAEWTNVTVTNRAAKFRSWDAETPVGKRDIADQRRVTLPPLGEKLVIGEYERIQLNAAANGGDPAAQLVARIYDDAALITQRARARMELARGDVLTDGKFTLAGENGMFTEADFGLDPTHNVTSDGSWDDPTFDIVEELRTWQDTYEDDAGEPAAEFLCSRRTTAALLRNDALRKLVFGRVNGTSALLTPAQVNDALTVHGLPLPRVVSTRVNVDGSSVRTTPEDKIILIPSDPSSLGITAWGITAEALFELVGGDNPSLVFSDAPGLVGVVMRGGDPVRRWTKVTGVGMPVIRDVRKLFVATVLLDS